MALRSLTFVCRDINKCINPRIGNYFQMLQPIATIALNKWNVLPHDRFIPAIQTSRRESSVAQPVRKVSMFQKIYTRMTGRKYMTFRLSRAALRMYLCTMELVDHHEIMRRFNLPDTLNSWFRITELHLWMLMCRLSKEGSDGKECRRLLVEYLWKDLKTKVQQLRGTGPISARNEGVLVLGAQFKASILSYDEGMLDNDKTLAGALWRNFFEKNCKATDLELLVEYVHRQMDYLHKIPSEEFLLRGVIKMVPMFQTEESKISYEKNLEKVLKAF